MCPRRIFVSSKKRPRVTRGPVGSGPSRLANAGRQVRAFAELEKLSKIHGGRRILEILSSQGERGMHVRRTVSQLLDSPQGIKVLELLVNSSAGRRVLDYFSTMDEGATVLTQLYTSRQLKGVLNLVGTVKGHGEVAKVLKKIW